MEQLHSNLARRRTDGQTKDLARLPTRPFAQSQDTDYSFFSTLVSIVLPFFCQWHHGTRTPTSASSSRRCASIVTQSRLFHGRFTRRTANVEHASRLFSFQLQCFGKATGYFVLELWYIPNPLHDTHWILFGLFKTQNTIRYTRLSRREYFDRWYYGNCSRHTQSRVANCIARLTGRHFGRLTARL